MNALAVGLGTVAMTPAQTDVWFNALPLWVKPFASANGAIQEQFCDLLPNDPHCLRESNPLYTQPVATATAPGLPVGYDPATGSCTDCAGSAAPGGDYGAALAQSLPDAIPFAMADPEGALKTGLLITLAIGAAILFVVLKGGR